jgi:integrase
MADIEAIAAPHRAARRLPQAKKYAAAVDWAETQILRELPRPEDVAAKVCAGEPLTDQEKRLIADALSKKSKGKGRPATKPGRDFWIRQLVNSVAREFQLSPTRGNISAQFSAADAVADGMKRAGVLPNSFDRVRKLYDGAKLEEKRAVRAFFEEQEKLRMGRLAAMRELLADLGLG